MQHKVMQQETMSQKNMPQKQRRVAIDARLTVVDAKLISASFIRVIFTCDKLLDVNPLWIGPHLKLQFADLNTGEITFPPRDENNKIIWQEGMRERVRTYSIRHYDSHLKQLSVDFVIHPSGVASVWAQQAKTGQKIGLLGMGSRYVFDDRSLVLVADSAAMPALCYTIEHKPKDQSIIAFIEVNDPSDRVDFKNGADQQINWLIRETGKESGLIEAVLQHQFIDIDHLLFWGGMEGGLTQQLRHQLKNKYPNLPSDAIQIINYWREGLAEGEFKHRD